MPQRVLRNTVRAAYILYIAHAQIRVAPHLTLALSLPACPTCPLFCNRFPLFFCNSDGPLASACRYHIVKTDKQILDHQTGDIKKRLLFEPIPGWWNVFRRALPEMFLLMVQIPPGIKTAFSMPAYNGEMVVYSVRVFNCVCFLRLYLFVRLLKNTSSLHAEDLSIVSDLRKTTDLEESKLLYIKSVVHQHTTTICFFCVMGGITIFA